MEKVRTVRSETADQTVPAAAAMDGFHDPISSIRGQSVRLSAGGSFLHPQNRIRAFRKIGTGEGSFVPSRARTLAKGEIEIKDSE